MIRPRTAAMMLPSTVTTSVTVRKAHSMSGRAARAWSQSQMARSFMACSPLHRRWVRQRPHAAVCPDPGGAWPAPRLRSWRG
ncbi:hypothetical protein ACLD0U_03155 [Microbacterium sp. 2216-1]|uniref:hypothetical protein n=1 Tax=Microbacterium sp. 2216-1 TaxID=3390053 RepID=UPI003976A7FA